MFAGGGKAHGPSCAPWPDSRRIAAAREVRRSRPRPPPPAPPAMAAASAYTHPLADVQQTKHIVGPAAYAALALGLAHAGRSR